jgi:hypothetical protein
MRVRDGVDVEAALKLHFGREVIQDVTCARCSLKATLQQADGAAGSAEVQRLRGLLAAQCPLPDCDWEALAVAAGLFWQPRGAPLVKRTSIARPPEVRQYSQPLCTLLIACSVLNAYRTCTLLIACSSLRAVSNTVHPCRCMFESCMRRCLFQVLVLQLRRVVWSASTQRLAKLQGCVAFPLVLDLQPYLSATAETLLPSVSLTAAAQHSTLTPSALWASGDAGAAAAACHGLSADEQPGAAGQASGSAEHAAACPPAAEGGEAAGCAERSGAREESVKPDAQRRRCLYKLTAVGVHAGKVAESGHYFAYRRVQSRELRASMIAGPPQGGEHAGEAASVIEHSPVKQSREVYVSEYWVCAMDEKVRRVSIQEVLACPDASFLVYERRM